MPKELPSGLYKRTATEREWVLLVRASLGEGMRHWWTARLQRLRGAACLQLGLPRPHLQASNVDVQCLLHSFLIEWPQWKESDEWRKQGDHVDNLPFSSSFQNKYGVRGLCWAWKTAQETWPIGICLSPSGKELSATARGGQRALWLLVAHISILFGHPCSHSSTYHAPTEPEHGYGHEPVLIS